MLNAKATLLSKRPKQPDYPYLFVKVKAAIR